MLTVSDMLKILEKAPIWKTLKDMPGRIEVLERRVAALEAAPGTPAHLLSCAQCGAPAKVTRVVAHPTLGTFGVKQRTITCAEGHAFEYRWDPNEK